MSVTVGAKRLWIGWSPPIVWFKRSGREVRAQCGPWTAVLTWSRRFYHQGFTGHDIVRQALRDVSG